MYWHATKVLPKQDYTLYVELQNRDKGIFDMKPYLDFGVFKELKDVCYFNKVDIVLERLLGLMSKILLHKCC